MYVSDQRFEKNMIHMVAQTEIKNTNYLAGVSPFFVCKKFYVKLYTCKVTYAQCTKGVTLWACNITD